MDKINLFDGKQAEVIDLCGDDDGYYWDWTSKFIVDDQHFLINIAGSSSGWIPTYEEITKASEPFKLSGVNAADEYYKNVHRDIVEVDTLTEKIKELYELFVNSGAKINYIRLENDDDEIETAVDRQPNKQ